MAVLLDKLFCIASIFIFLVVLSSAVIAQPPPPPSSPAGFQSSENAGQVNNISNTPSLEDRVDILESKMKDLETKKKVSPYLALLIILNILLMIIVVYLLITVRSERSKGSIRKDINNKEYYQE